MEVTRSEKIKEYSSVQKNKTKQSNHILNLAGKLDWSPKKNWVENEGGLPKYIEEIALALIRNGMTRERAIATAISRIKAWIADPDTKPDTKAKAAKALAQWNKMKASAKAKRAAK